MSRKGGISFYYCYYYFASLHFPALGSSSTTGLEWYLQELPMEVEEHFALLNNSEKAYVYTFMQV